MPDYRKKKVRRVARPSRQKAPAERSKGAFDISMSPKRNEKAEKEKPVRVIKGKKLQHRRNFRITALAAAIAAAAICVLHFLLPIGIIENMGNFTATIGSGAYPLELYGTEVISAAQKGSYYFALTDTELTAYSNGGKKIFTEAHGYAKPVLKTSETRALIFDLGGNSLSIFNLSGSTNSLKTDNKLLSAAITRCGAYAVATASDSYAAEVTVYSSEDKKLYQWYSSSDLVNGVLLSPDGKRLAVSTVNASDGVLKSRLAVFEYSSADPIFSAEYSGTAIYSLDGLKHGFTAITAEGCSYFDWDKLNRRDYKNDYEPSALKTTKYGLALVFSRASDKSDNHILILSQKGEQLAAFNFLGNISDIVFSDNHIYCISDTAVYMLDKNGELISRLDCGYGAERLVAIGGGSVAVMTGGDIKKFSFS